MCGFLSNAATAGSKVALIERNLILLSAFLLSFKGSV